jgi:histidinol-phosphatase (PHP family)
MNEDYHTHTTYSDGSFLHFMLSGAEEAGLEAIGFADHANVSTREPMRHHKKRTGFNLDMTYERRRQAIERLRDRMDLTIYDAVEVDYDPRDEAEIRSFLETAHFDYALGSVHFVDGVNVHIAEPHRSKSESEKRALVDDYFDDLERLVRSELFEVAAHPDIVERNAALRGLADEDHYHQVAAAFAEARTVPEINAGRVLMDFGQFHPTPDFLDVLLEYDFEVTVGTDAHEPQQIPDRVAEIRDLLAERGLEPVSPFSV